MAITKPVSDFRKFATAICHKLGVDPGLITGLVVEFDFEQQLMLVSVAVMVTDAGSMKTVVSDYEFDVRKRIEENSGE